MPLEVSYEFPFSSIATSGDRGGIGNDARYEILPDDDVRDTVEH